MLPSVHFVDEYLAQYIYFNRTNISMKEDIRHAGGEARLFLLGIQFITRTVNISVSPNCLHQQDENITPMKMLDLIAPEHIAIRKNTEKVVLSSTSESEGALPLKDDSDTLEEWEENDCTGCGENYKENPKADDWIQCII